MASAVHEPIQLTAQRNQTWAIVGDYIALTKPRIIELLLVTTVPAMMLAARWLPSSTLVVRDSGRRRRSLRVPQMRSIATSTATSMPSCSGRHGDR